MRALLVILLLFTAPTAARAQFSGTTAHHTVETARSLPDESPVTLRGRIAARIDDEEYSFVDPTGEIRLWVAPGVWAGVAVTPDDDVEISGEVDRGLIRTEINVTSVRIIE